MSIQGIQHHEGRVNEINNKINALEAERDYVIENNPQRDCTTFNAVEIEAAYGELYIVDANLLDEYTL